MRHRLFQSGCCLAALAIVALVASPAFAQGGAREGRGQRAERRAERNPGPGRPGGARQPNPRQLMGLPPRWLERVQEMSPEQQERFLANNERFKSLPPERQAQIRRRLQQWNRLTPQQRMELRERARVWEQMSPEERRHVREELLPKWRQVPPQRRQTILAHLRELHGLSREQRAAKLSDPKFLEGLSPDEQGMLRDLSNLRLGPPPESPGNP